MRSPSFTALEVVVVLAVLTIASLFAVGARHKSHGVSNRTRCASQLRQLGLAALQYSDDKRFLPHVGPLRTLDGDFHDGGPTTTSKAFRALTHYGYTDDTVNWICPSSFDMPRPPAAAVTTTPRAWFWGSQAKAGQLDASPFVDGLPDPAIADTDELSYGWTRKGLNRNCRSTQPLAADRAVRAEELARVDDQLPGHVGNHGDGWSVLFADASVLWVGTEPDSWWSGDHPAEVLVGTRSPSDASLAIHDQRATYPAGS